MRFPNQRLAQLFDLLQNETLPQDELAQRLQQNEAAEVTDGATEENGKLTSDNANTEEVSVSPVKL